MIYSIFFYPLAQTVTRNTWSHHTLKKYVGVGEYVNLTNVLGDYIKNSTDDKFVFIITPEYMETFDTFIRSNQLEELIVYRMPHFITNPNYPEDGRRLKLIVLANNKTQLSSI